MMINQLVLNNLETSEEKATEKAVQRFEKMIKASLPRDYRDFVLQTNGGYLKKALSYPISQILQSGIQNRSDVDHFYGLSEVEGEGTLIENFEIFRDKNEPRMLNYMIPIATDQGGNQIVLLLNKNEFGHIYFWDHESEVDFDNLEKGENERSNCHKIANSFSELLGLLESDED